MHPDLVQFTGSMRGTSRTMVDRFVKSIPRMPSPGTNLETYQKCALVLSCGVVALPSHDISYTNLHDDGCIRVLGVLSDHLVTVKIETVTPPSVHRRVLPCTTAFCFESAHTMRSMAAGTNNKRMSLMGSVGSCWFHPSILLASSVILCNLVRIVLGRVKEPTWMDLQPNGKFGTATRSYIPGNGSI